MKLYERLKALLFDNDLNSILKKSGGGFAIKMTHILIGFLTSMFMARWFGAAILGEYTFAMTIINFLKVLAVFGFPTLTIREVAKLHERGQLRQLKKYLASSNFIVFSFSLLLCLGYYIVLELQIINVSSGSVKTLKYSIPALIFLSLINIHSSALRGRGFIIKSLLQEQFFRPLFFLIFLILLYVISSDFSINSIIFYQVIAIIIAFVLGILMLKPFLGQISKVELPKIEVINYLKLASPFLLLGGIQILNSQIDIFMLGVFLEATEVGIYKVAFSVSQVILFVMVSMNTTLTPDMAKLFDSDRKQELEKILVQTSRIVFVLSVPIALIYFAFGKEILGLAFGSEFEVGYYALVIITVGMLVNALAGPTAGILNMTGFEKYAFWGSVTMCFFNVILNYILIPIYGIEGAAFTTALAPIFANTVWLYHIKTKVGISITALGNI